MALQRETRSISHPAAALFRRDMKLAFRRLGESLLPLFFLFTVIVLIPLGVGPGDRAGG